MPNRFASGRNSIAECDRCGFRYKLKQLKTLVIKTKNVNLLVCPSCWEPDQPQLQLGMYPVDDPQGVRDPRPDTSYYAEGNDGAGGSRVFQWGWAPVGGGSATSNTPNDLIGQTSLGTISVSITVSPTPPGPSPATGIVYEGEYNYSPPYSYDGYSTSFNIYGFTPPITDVAGSISTGTVATPYNGTYQIKYLADNYNAGVYTGDSFISLVANTSDPVMPIPNRRMIKTITVGSNTVDLQAMFFAGLTYDAWGTVSPDYVYYQFELYPTAPLPAGGLFGLDGTGQQPYSITIANFTPVSTSGTVTGGTYTSGVLTEYGYSLDTATGSITGATVSGVTTIELPGYLYTYSTVSGTVVKVADVYDTGVHQYSEVIIRVPDPVSGYYGSFNYSYVDRIVLGGNTYYTFYAQFYSVVTIAGYSDLVWQFATPFGFNATPTQAHQVTSYQEI